MSAAIEVSELSVDRGGRRVLDELELSVEPAQVTGLIGPSGCGKTTMMRAIVGVQVVAGGGVEVLGAPAGSAALRTRVAYVTQAPSVYGDLTVRENLNYFARLLRVGEDRVAQVVGLTGLDGLESRMTRSLSGGQLSRVSLATAFLNEPELLVLDEPTVGLDPVLRAELWTTFRRLAEGGTTLLVSSHVMDEAAECDRLLLMHEGAILRDATPAELRSETGEENLSKAFLALIRMREAA